MLEYWIVGFGSVLSLLPFLLSYIDLLSDCVGDGLNLNLIRLSEGFDLALIRLAEGFNLMSMRLLLFLYCPPRVWLDPASALPLPLQATSPKSVSTLTCELVDVLPSWTIDSVQCVLLAIVRTFVATTRSFKYEVISVLSAAMHLVRFPLLQLYVASILSPWAFVPDD